MKDLDLLIQQALNPEFALTLTQEESLREEIAETFRGKQKWLTYGWILDFIGCIGLMVVSIYKVANTDDVRTTVIWCSLCLFSFLAMGLLKLWYWLYMSRNKMLRELKRLELAVVVLSRPQETK